MIYFSKTKTTTLLPYAYGTGYKLSKTNTTRTLRVSDQQKTAYKSISKKKREYKAHIVLNQVLAWCIFHYYKRWHSSYAHIQWNGTEPIILRTKSGLPTLAIKLYTATALLLYLARFI